MKHLRSICVATLMALALASGATMAQAQATLSYNYGTTNFGYLYRPLNIAASNGGAPVWSMSLWVPAAGALQTAHNYWTAGEIASFKDLQFGGGAFEYSPEPGNVASHGVFRMSTFGGDFLDGTDLNSHQGQTPYYYQFTKTSTLSAGVVNVLTVTIHAPTITGPDYQTRIEADQVITNTSGAAYALSGTAAGNGSLNLATGGFTTWAFVNPTAGTVGVNSHLTDVTDGHQLYSVYDWYGSTVTSALPGYYAKMVVRNNGDTQSRNMRPGLTFELRADNLDFYYCDAANRLYGQTAAGTEGGVSCKLASQPYPFGQNAMLPSGQSATMRWVATISTLPLPIPPKAEAGPDQIVTDANDDGFETVTLNGTDSVDPDGEVVDYSWFEGGNLIATGATAQVSLTLGYHVITLLVTDNQGGTDTDTVTVGVIGSRLYVDFEGGHDANDGFTPATAWKHCPGDVNATGLAAAKVLEPGNKVHFKGGVRYYGTVTINRSGSAEFPIVYDGNTAGDWGTGRAIIDGSVPFGGWTQCQSQEEAGGNLNWQHIWYAYAPAGTSSRGSNIFENDGQSDRFCWLAQDPNQPDPAFMGDINFFHDIPNDQVTTTSLTDPLRLTQTDADYWNGAFVMVWVQPNLVNYRAIESFDKDLYMITYAATGAPYTNKTELYAIFNSIHLIDVPGEYYFNDLPEPDGTHKVWLWPQSGGNPNQEEFSASVRNLGIVAPAPVSHVTIQGFRIQKLSGDYIAQAIRIYGTSSVHCDNIKILNNHTYGIRAYGDGQGVSTINLSSPDNSLIQGNTLELSFTNRGIMVGGGSNNIIDSNVITKVDGTCIYYGGVHDSLITNNRISNCHGTHANGITAYEYCDNILIAYNSVVDANISITTQKSSNLTIAYNVCRYSTDPARDFYVFADWGNCTNLRVHNNTFIRSSDKPAIVFSATSSGETRNNVTNNWAPFGEDAATQNYYFSLAQLPTLFVDPANGDYHLKPGSPLLNRGLDLGYTRDFDGLPVPQGGAPDIGAYEFAVAPVVSAGLSYNWLYQNAPVTTGNRHHCLLTVAVSGAANYSVIVTKVAGPGQLVVEGTANQLLWIIRGGLRSDGAAGTGPVTLRVTVTDNLTHLTATTDLDLTVRALGDIDGAGGVSGQDKLQMNKRLNGLVPDGREFDLDGFGGASGQDKLILNRILNGHVLP